MSATTDAQFIVDHVARDRIEQIVVGFNGDPVVRRVDNVTSKARRRRCDRTAQGGAVRFRDAAAADRLREYFVGRARRREQEGEQIAPTHQCPRIFDRKSLLRSLFGMGEELVGVFLFDDLALVMKMTRSAPPWQNPFRGSRKAW